MLAVNRKEKAPVWVWGPERAVRLLRGPVYALAVSTLDGLQLETHLLADGPAQEPPHAVALPAGELHQLRDGRAIFSAQHFNDGGGLAEGSG